MNLLENCHNVLSKMSKYYFYAKVNVRRLPYSFLTDHVTVQNGGAQFSKTRGARRFKIKCDFSAMNARHGLMYTSESYLMSIESSLYLDGANIHYVKAKTEIMSMTAGQLLSADSVTV